MITEEQRIAQVCTIKISSACEQIVPELAMQAANAIHSTNLVIAKHPKHTTELTQVLDLKLAIMKETYICDRIQKRVRAGGKAWTKTEKQQVVRLQNKQREHNALVTKLAHLIAR